MPRAQAPHRQISPWLTAWPLIGWVLGCALQLQQARLGPQWGYATALALAALLVWRWRPACQPAACLGAVLALALAGWGSTGWRATAFAEHALPPALEGADITVQGVIVSLPQATGQGQRWLFAPEQGWNRAGAPVPLPPRLALNHYDPGLTVRAGERWRWTVRLKRPHGTRNPQGFDAEQWWWSQGVQATGYVRPLAPAQRLGSTRQAPLEQAREQVRQRLHATAGSTRAAGVVVALVTGEQGAIARADWQIFRATGVAHLVSISGLHITMFAWLSVLLVGGLWRRSRWLSLRWPAPLAAAWAGLLLALGYALFSGWGIPAQRTLLMLLAVTLLRSLGVRWPWPRIWLLVLAVVVAWDPWALLQAGFWLSFVAVGVLFMTDPGHPSGPRRWWHPLWRLVREQTLIGLALAPLTLLLFGQVSIVGFFANLWAIPWVTLLLTPLAMAGVLLPPLWTAAVWCAELLLTVLAWMAQWPLAVAYFAQPPLALGMVGMIGCLWLLLRWPWPLRLLGLPLVLPMLLWQPRPPPQGEFSLLALDVGQGSSILVQTAGHTLLVDAGPRWNDGDAGSQIIVPLLHALGLRLDAVLLTHPDSDHTGGALSILAAQPLAALHGSGIADIAAQAQRPWQTCTQGQQWTWEQVTFTVLWPPPTANGTQPPRKPSTTNASSCVIRVRSVSGAVALLTGDMERAQEQALLRANADVRADALLVAHHGSRTSTSAAWVAAVQPQVALVQSGWRNRFGHPAAPVVQRLQTAQARLFNTATCGAIHWHSMQPHTARCERERQPHYWNKEYKN